MKHWAVLFIRLLFGFGIGTFMLNTVSYAPYLHIIMKNGFYSAGLFMFIYILFLTLSVFIVDRMYEKTDWFEKKSIKYPFCLVWSFLGVFACHTFLTSVQLPLWINILLIIQLTLSIQEDNDPLRKFKKKYIK